MAARASHQGHSRSGSVRSEQPAQSDRPGASIAPDRDVRRKSLVLAVLRGSARPARLRQGFAHDNRGCAAWPRRRDFPGDSEGNRVQPELHRTQLEFRALAQAPCLDITYCVIFMAQESSMTGADVLKARKAQRVTQHGLAERLGVSQAYVSFLEKGRRPVTARLAKRLVRELVMSPDTLPLDSSEASLAADKAAPALGRLGYPGFAYLKNGQLLNPAEMLLRTLRAKSLDSRLLEALPWVVVTYPNLNWSWLLYEARANALQNRLGFVVTMAKELATGKGDLQTAATLAHWENALEDSRLLREDGFRETLTEAERRWLRAHRSEAAGKWNVLSNLDYRSLQNAL